MPQKTRPLSPHLQVYDMLRITSLTSVLHRLTGLALVAGSLLILWWLLALASGPQAYATFNHTAQSWIGQIVLFGFTWAFWYQLINGIRHLFWDAGLGFKIETARLSGKLILSSSILLTLITWFYVVTA